MQKFKEFIKKLPIAYVGLDNDHVPLIDMVKKYGPNLPTGFAGFLRKPEDDLVDPKNREVKEEAPPPIPKTVKIPEYHYDHVKFLSDQSHDRSEHPEHNHNDWRSKILPIYGHHRDSSQHEIAAIRHYTSHSAGLNQFLIKRHIGSPITDYDHEGYNPDTHHRLMDVASRNKTHEDMTLYSGVGFTHPGKHPDVHLPAFTSMSHDPVIARNFAKPDLDPITNRGDDNLTHMFHWHSFQHHGSAIMHPDHVKEMNSKYSTHDFTARSHFAHSIGHHYGMPKDTVRGAVSSPYPINHMLQIHVPAGSHVIVPGIHTSYPEEREVVAAAGSNIRLDHTKLPRLYMGGTMVHHVNLETPKL